MSSSGEGLVNSSTAVPFSSASAAPSSASSSSSTQHPLPLAPQPSSVVSASSSSSVATIGRECAKCLSYLTRALDGGTTSSSSSSSRPATLLRALGVISPMVGRRTNTENKENGSDVDRGSSSEDRGSRSYNKIYELTPNGRGVMIRLEDHHHAHTNNNNSNEGKVQVENVHDSQHRESMVGASGDNSHQQQNQPQHKEPIHRRLSNAASQCATNISAQHDNNNAGIVLTTSPLSSSSTGHSSESPAASTKESSITTITIECSPCGSDTRAEASARAYVRGPDPLGIVLCSNRLGSQREIEEVLVHELVHIYDVHVRQMDLRDCKQLAYSEVRAAREAECGNR
jgi:hypothetical protein